LRLVLEVVDEARCTGARGGRVGRGHFRVTIVAERFRGVPRLERHRMVHEALAAELVRDIHALAVSARSPDESAA
jgi:BolA protein